jgi:hypothetical protein
MLGLDLASEGLVEGDLYKGLANDYSCVTRCRLRTLKIKFC